MSVEFNEEIGGTFAMAVPLQERLEALEEGEEDEEEEE